MVTAETSQSTPKGGSARGVGTERRLNLYEVLQVSTSACPEVVHAAYRALARSYHPDVNPGEEAARQMRQLNAAYHVLSDPERRARYDTVRIRPMRARRPAESPVEARPRSVDTVFRPTPINIQRSRGGGHRLWRLLIAVAFLLLIIGALTVSMLWALDDEPTRGMTPSAADVVLTLGR